MKLHNDLSSSNFNEEFKNIINEFNSLTYSLNAKLTFIKKCITIESDKN